jgi:hypothetical protein
LILRRSLLVLPDKQTFSQATPIGCSFPRCADLSSEPGQAS